MPILQVTCPECKSKLASKKGFTAGEVISCPKCETYFEVEAPKVAVPAKPAAPLAKPVAKRPAVVEDEEEDDRPRKKKRPADDDEDDDRPRKKKKPVVEVLEDDEDEDEEEDDDRPRKKKRKKSSDDIKNSPVRYVVLGILVTIMIVLGVMLILKLQNEAKEGRAPVPVRVG